MQEQDARATAASPAKIWLASYPPVVPAEIEPSRDTSLSDVLEASCKRHAARIAFTSMGRDMTYGDLDEKSRAIAAWLQSIGLTRGDRVAVMMPNVLQNPVAVYAILRAGFVVVNINPLYTPRELEYQLDDSGAKAIFVLENFARTVQQDDQFVGGVRRLVESVDELPAARKILLGRDVRIHSLSPHRDTAAKLRRTLLFLHRARDTVKRLALSGGRAAGCRHRRRGRQRFRQHRAGRQAESRRRGDEHPLYHVPCIANERLTKV